MHIYREVKHVIHIKLGIGILAFKLFYEVTKAFLLLLNYVCLASALRHQDPYGIIGHG
jgi:hypothetical protein